MLGPEDVVVRDDVERNAGLELRQRRAGEDVHLVAGAVPLAGQVGGVDPLAAAVHVPAICQQGDAHVRAVQAEPLGAVSGSLSISGVSGSPS